MGQKVDPKAFRLGRFMQASSRWYVKRGQYSQYVIDDARAREYIYQKYAAAGVNEILILRSAQTAQVKIYCAKPGIIIGRRGEDVDTLRHKVQDILTVPSTVSVEEIKKPDLYAKLVAEMIASQLVRRGSFRKAIKRAAQNTMRQGAQGVKIIVSGRLGGAEIARSEKTAEGRVPLHTFRSNIDYAGARAKTVYGIIGVKVWIYKGEYS